MMSTTRFIISALISIPIVMSMNIRSFDFGSNTKENFQADWNNPDLAAPLMNSGTPPDLASWANSNPLLQQELPKIGRSRSAETPQPSLQPPDTSAVLDSVASSTIDAKPQFRDDCSVDQNLCLGINIKLVCPPGKDCAMSQDCSSIVCVGENGEVDESSAHGVTTDKPPTCPPHRNLCRIFPCPSGKSCSMNDECTATVCSDPSEAGVSQSGSASSPTVPPSGSHVLDCLSNPSKNLCLFHSGGCLSHQECTMDKDCTAMICVDKNTDTAEARTSGDSSAHGVTTDKPPTCPPHRNLCRIFPCPSGKTCSMNDKCTATVCSDPSEAGVSQSGSSSSPTEQPSGTLSDCLSNPSKNLCLFHSGGCLPHQECTMNKDCTARICVETNTSTALAQTGAENTSEGQRQQMCPKGPKVECVHGVCGPDNKTCSCDEGWQGLFCEEHCTLSCVHGGCYVDRENGDNMICNCMYGWQGHLCDEVVPDLVDEAEKRTLKIALSLGVALLVTIVVSAVVLVVMWRRRVIVVMKLVYFFRMKEDDDGRLYDAYVSTGSSSQALDFVKSQLCPKLEDQGFHLYVQARDQMVNEVVSESILNAMANSRRTILVLTLDYLNNEWSRFEYIVAQIETLKMQQRIIPIVLEDISSEKRNMNVTLKHILDSVKCLKYPQQKIVPESPIAETIFDKTKKKEERFWKRLELTMPKKRSPSTTKEPQMFSSSKSSELSIVNVEPVKGVAFTNLFSSNI